MIITPDDMLDDDIHLVAGGETAFLLDSAGQAISGAPGYYAYFLGVTSTTGFTSASIEYASGVEDAFLYNIDDITVAKAPTAGVPEPDTLVLLLGGIPAWLLRRSRLV